MPIESFRSYAPVTERGTKRRPTEIVYVEQRLDVWARWFRSHRDEIGFPTVSLLYKAMRQKAVRVAAGDPLEAVGAGLTAAGRESASFGPQREPEPPEAVVEVDDAVRSIAAHLREVLVVDYFTLGNIDERCARTPYKRARYSQLLESAKFAVHAILASRRESSVEREAEK